MPPGPEFTLTQLRYFIAVADASSISEAAKKLLIAQSAVSTSVANLEHQLSVQLFVRNHAKGVQLTHAGRRFLVRARELLDHSLEISEFGRDLGRSLIGDLSVGCFAFIAPFFLPAILAAFRDQQPRVRVTLTEDNLEEVQRSLLSGACEVAFLYDVNLSPRLEKELVKSYQPYVLLPAGHRLAREKRIALKDLEREPLIQIDLPHSRDYVERLAKHSGLELNVAFRTTSFEMVRSLVGHGQGYSILNQRLPQDRTCDGQPLASRSAGRSAAHPPGARPCGRSAAVAARARLRRRVARILCERLPARRPLHDRQSQGLSRTRGAPARRAYSAASANCRTKPEVRSATYCMKS